MSNEMIGTIQLPREGAKFDGQECHIAGWGRIEGMLYSREMAESMLYSLERGLIKKMVCED